MAVESTVSIDRRAGIWDILAVPLTSQFLTDGPASPA
jgi:hypothetical protein